MTVFSSALRRTLLVLGLGSLVLGCLVLCGLRPATAVADESDFLEQFAPDLGSGRSGARALLTILYNASSHGILHPCPT